VLSGKVWGIAAEHGQKCLTKRRNETQDGSMHNDSKNQRNISNEEPAGPHTPALCHMRPYCTVKMHIVPIEFMPGSSFHASFKLWSVFSVIQPATAPPVVSCGVLKHSLSQNSAKTGPWLGCGLLVSAPGGVPKQCLVSAAASTGAIASNSCYSMITRPTCSMHCRTVRLLRRWGAPACS
jgi:hypothetical protein